MKPSPPPSDGWIAFEREGQLWLIHPDGSGLIEAGAQPVPAVSTAKSLTWSPDGRLLAYVDAAGDLIALDVETSSSVTLMQEMSGGFDWSPDGSQIVYGARRSDPSQLNDGLLVVDTDGGTKELVESSERFPGMRSPDWSPDGSQILFLKPCDGVCGYGVAGVETGDVISLPLYQSEHPHLCQWSPSGSLVACVQGISDNAEKLEVVLYDPYGWTVDEIPLSTEEVPSILWSPDGGELAVGYSSGTGYRTDLLSFEDETRASLASGVPVTWSPDGQWLVTSDFDDGFASHNLIVVDLASGNSYPLTDAQGVNIAWQPSGMPLAALPQAPSGNAAVSTPAPTPRPTSTPTQTGCAGGLTVTSNRTSGGEFLQVCVDNEEYEVGPLERGAFAVGPNQVFFIYCTNSGVVYASRAGDATLTVIGDVRSFTIIAQGEDPSLEFEFLGNHPYQIKIHERTLNQDKILPIPRYLTSPN